MVGIVIVSHSCRVAEGIKDLALQLINQNTNVIAAGGMVDGSLGTDAVRISSAIMEADVGDGVVVLVDLGSAVLSSNMALELLSEDMKCNARIADAPILEGTICAVIQASIGASLDEVVAAAEEARGMKKL
jgi:dihydroxyacetone kinase phosphotransfer subunit